MHAKRLFLTLNLLLMALSAGALHAAEVSQAAAKPYDCPAPILPVAAVREDMSGDVTLQYQASAQGKFADIKIVKSSGFRELDKAALIALSRCKLPVSAAGELPPPGTMEFKFGRQVRVDSAPAAPVLAPESKAALAQ